MEHWFHAQLPIFYPIQNVYPTLVRWLQKPRIGINMHKTKQAQIEKRRQKAAEKTALLKSLENKDRSEYFNFVSNMRTYQPTQKEHKANIEYLQNFRTGIYQIPVEVVISEITNMIYLLKGSYGDCCAEAMFDVLQIVKKLGVNDPRVKTMLSVIPQVIEKSW